MQEHAEGRDRHHRLAPQRQHGSQVARHAGPMRSWRHGTTRRMAPIFAVHDLDAAMAYCQRPGFAVRAYPGGGYGFAFHSGIEIHPGVVLGDDRRTSSACTWRLTVL